MLGNISAPTSAPWAKRSLAARIVAAGRKWPHDRNSRPYSLTASLKIIANKATGK